MDPRAIPSDSATGTVNNTRKLRRDLRVLVRFIDVYCHRCHRGADRGATHIDLPELAELCGQLPDLCDSCRRLLAYACTRRYRCPLDPKPACKHCPTHCYAPVYRAQIREVMKHSGRYLVLRGRLDYLLHLIR